MYLKHFGMKQKPFRTTPDSEFYYPATIQETTLARLSRALADDEGLALLTGAPGLGKTWVCHRLLEQVGEKTVTAYLLHTHFHDHAGLLQAILYDLMLPFEGKSEQELRLNLTDFLLKSFEAGRKTMILVDEAHHLSIDQLEELRLLSNLAGSAGRAVHVVLAAQPCFEKQLRRPELEVFRQRLVIRECLEPLDLHESADFLLHQVRAAGGRPERIFSDEAVEVLARNSSGVPRLLNQAAHQALSLAFDAKARCVDAEAALEALAILGLASEENDRQTAMGVAGAVHDRESKMGSSEEAVLSLSNNDRQAASGIEPPDEETQQGRIYNSPRRPA